MKVVTIIGARPQFIKAAVVSKEINKRGGIEEVIVHTGQHFDSNMSEIFFNQMKIPHAKYNLGISSLSHGSMTGRMLEKIEDILLEENPDWILVYGDTNSTLAGALAASKLHIKVAHIEAGLRSFNMKMPEEQNRVLTDQISTILFCPTLSAIVNLEREGIAHKNKKIFNVGDVMLDASQQFKKFSQVPKQLNTFDFSKPFVLSTLHRAENTDDLNRLSEIVSALNEINKTMPVILPLHPRTKAKLVKSNLNLNVTVIEPVGYLEMIFLTSHCRLVICDSGGLQKEAYFLGKPCVTMRDETEWVELVDSGVNVLVGADKTRIVEGFGNMLDINVDKTDIDYGAGHACERIVGELLSNRC